MPAHPGTHAREPIREVKPGPRSRGTVGEPVSPTARTAAPAPAATGLESPEPDLVDAARVEQPYDESIAEGIVITIDGPAGTGKSSVARQLALRLGLDFLDSGAMYRAAAALALDHGLATTDAVGDTQKFVDLVASADLHFDWRTDPPAILAWDKPLGDRIRDHDVTLLVSRAAATPELRHHLVRKQRIIAHQHPKLVSEGRDQGSVAFPDAACKFYLDARPDVRAKRRLDQLEAAGKPHASLDDIIDDINRRDASDRARTDGPLVCPAGAIVLDTSELSIDQVLDHLEASARTAVPALRG